MVKKIKLVAETIKDKGDSSSELKKQGMVPAIVYGKGVENVKLKVKKHALEIAYLEAGESSLVDVEIDGQEIKKVIIKDIQRDFLKDHITHVDFYQVDMNKTIEVEVPFHFINESKAEKELGGILNRNLNTITVKCLPGDLVENIDIDLSVLNTFEDIIRVADVKVPSNFEILSAPDEVVVSVVEKEEEFVAPVKIEETVAKPGEAKTAAAGDAKKDDAKKSK
jgi:large subunit ribosomal protein L25